MQPISNILATLEKKGILKMPATKTTPIKVGLFGEQGTGKTTTAALMCAAISKKYCDGAPVWVTDPELGWKFTKKRIFGPEGITLEQRTVPTFAAMMDDLYKAERAGASCYAVELAKPWIELLETVKRKCRDSWGPGTRASLESMGDAIHEFATLCVRASPRDRSHGRNRE
jgi:hypothetical protein